MSSILSYCRITEEGFYLNGNFHKHSNCEDFALEIYKQLNLSYPKFHKMDLLAKTAFLGSEILIQQNQLPPGMSNDEMALIFGNSESSGHADLSFYRSYHHHSAPSPSDFVYTLPNILLGEIAIKNNWYGENLFLILPEFNAKEFVEQISITLTGRSRFCLGGWVNVLKHQVDAFFFFVSRENAGPALTGNYLQKLYTDHHE